MKGPFDGRTTGEILVLLIGFTVCGYVVTTAILVIILAFATDRDLSKVAGNIGDIINTLIGLLAGFLAGRTELNRRRQENTKDDE